MKTIFITGSSTGLGKATVLLFARKGWRVIATMRNPEIDTELTLLDNVVLLPLDVSSPEQIKATVKQATDLGVDVVFNNAGYGLGGPLEGYTEDQILGQINTNLLGVILVTQAFIPYFRQRQSGLFLTTTSIGGRITFPFYSVYCAAKWGVEGFCESLSFELSQFGIGVKTIAPGGIRSAFRASSDNAQNEAYAASFGKVINAFMSGKTPTIVSEPEQIAEIVYGAATDGSDQLRYAAGADAETYVAQRKEKGDETFRRDLGKLFFGE
jgi:NAD(P)-dependent dehydrogenase (short-subunit alcohol dehydrogenase family)